jgi:ketosteroid isomerase-like protein
MNRFFTFATAAVVTLAVLAGAGCAGLDARSDEEQIVERLESFRDAAKTQDIDGILAVLADDFYHPELGGKEQARLLLEMAIAQGYLDDGEITWEDMEIQISEDGKTATAGPIDASGPPGAIALVIEGKKGDDGVWYLSGGDQY